VPACHREDRGWKRTKCRATRPDELGVKQLRAWCPEVVKTPPGFHVPDTLATTPHHPSPLTTSCLGSSTQQPQEAWAEKVVFLAGSHRIESDRGRTQSQDWLFSAAAPDAHWECTG
jgi:hypothetical protein